MKQRTATSHFLLLPAFLLTTVMVAPAQGPNAQNAPRPSPANAALTAPADATGSPANAESSPSPSTASRPKVSRIEGNLELDEVVRVEVANLSEWIATNDPRKLVPFLNGREIRGNYPEEIHPSQNQVHFHLEITPESKEAWTDLLGEPAGARRPVSFSVGLEGQAPFDSVYSQSNRLPLTVIAPLYGLIALVVVLATLILFIWLARKTNIIRAPGPNPGGGKLRPYNLGRAQMAFWFFLVYTSYMTIWIITDALDTITPSLLGLMGISAGTALSEALIDSGKDSGRAAQLQDLNAERQTLEQSIADLQSQIGSLSTQPTSTPEAVANRDALNKTLQDSRTRLAQVNQQLQTLASSAGPEASSGFLRDILSDGDGYSFHRFQIFAWTIVLGIIFVSSVYNNLTMPEFSATLLGLMGLSSGTYIGFKFPEQK